MFAVSELVS